MKRIVLTIAVLVLLIPAGLLAQEKTTTLDSPVVTASQSGTAIKLSWPAVSGATRDAIWAWKNESEGWYALDRNFSGTSYTHSDVTTGTTYWYSVRAENDANQVSPWSEYASATAPAQTGGGDASTDSYTASHLHAISNADSDSYAKPGCDPRHLEVMHIDQVCSRRRAMAGHQRSTHPKCNDGRLPREIWGEPGGSDNFAGGVAG